MPSLANRKPPSAHFSQVQRRLCFAEPMRWQNFTCLANGRAGLFCSTNKCSAPLLFLLAKLDLDLVYSEFLQNASSEQEYCIQVSMATLMDSRLYNNPSRLHRNSFKWPFSRF